VCPASTSTDTCRCRGTTCATSLARSCELRDALWRAWCFPAVCVCVRMRRKLHTLR
jgi:hypothetical protein